MKTDRRGFLRFLGLSAAAGVAAAVVPEVVKAMPAPQVVPAVPLFNTAHPLAGPGRLYGCIRPGDLVPFSDIADDQYGLLQRFVVHPDQYEAMKRLFETF